MNILVVDDFKQDRETLAGPFRADHDVRTAADLDEAKKHLHDWWPDVALVDAFFPPRRNEPPKFMAESFLEYLESRQADYAYRPQIILVSGQADAAKRFDTVRQWLSYGRIADVLPKSMADAGMKFFVAVVKFRVDLALERLRWRPVQANAETDAEWFQSLGIATRSPSVLALRKSIVAAARSNLCVLLFGQMGCGKELVAQAIHKVGRPGKRFLDADCSAIPTELFEAEMFGIKGWGGPGSQVFIPKPGLLEVVKDGTILLDEVQNLKPDHQAKLRHVLQERNFRAVGGIDDIPFYGKFIAATNVDLRRLIEAGSFREDLFYRMSAFVIEIPRLSERVEDIQLLVDQFLGAFVQDRRKSGDACPAIHLNQRCLSALMAYDWPGNIRELKGVVEKCAEFAATAGYGLSDAEITPELLREHAPQVRAARLATGAAAVISRHDEILGAANLGVLRWREIGEPLKDRVREEIATRLSAAGCSRLAAMEVALQPRAAGAARSAPGRDTQYPETIHCLKALLYLVLVPDHRASLQDFQKICGLTWDPCKRIIQILGAVDESTSPAYEPLAVMPAPKTPQVTALLPAVLP